MVMIFPLETCHIYFWELEPEIFSVAFFITILYKTIHSFWS